MERMMDGMNGGMESTAPMPEMGTTTDGDGAGKRPRPKRSRPKAARPKAAKKARKSGGKKRAKKTIKARTKARKTTGRKRAKKRARR
jgi:hypothetical protein